MSGPLDGPPTTSKFATVLDHFGLRGPVGPGGYSIKKKTAYECTLGASAVGCPADILTSPAASSHTGRITAGRAVNT